MPHLPAPVLLVTLLAGCGLQPHHSDRWTGPLTPATPSPNCAATQGMAQITNGAVFFAPDNGTWILNGTATPDGNLNAERSQPGANHQPYETHLEAKWSAETIAGKYITPRCTYNVQLTRR